MEEGRKAHFCQDCGVKNPVNRSYCPATNDLHITRTVTTGPIVIKGRDPEKASDRAFKKGLDAAAWKSGWDKLKDSIEQDDYDSLLDEIIRTGRFDCIDDYLDKE
mgnify:CR=1 FL=1